MFSERESQQKRLTQTAEAAYFPLFHWRTARSRAARVSQAETAFRFIDRRIRRGCGLVTLEDVLEELVGEIQDEFDLDKEMISRLAENAFLVDGLTPLHDVAEEIGVELESEEVSTFGGYITLKLGRMPHLNEVFWIDRLQITVGNVDDRRVIAASIEVLSEGKTNEEVEERVEFQIFSQRGHI